MGRTRAEDGLIHYELSNVLLLTQGTNLCIASIVSRAQSILVKNHQYTRLDGTYTV